MAVPTKEQKFALICEWTDSGRARDLRERAGLSLEVSAGKCKVTKGAVLRWERAERRPRGSRNIDAYYRLLKRLAAEAGEA